MTQNALDYSSLPWRRRHRRKMLARLGIGLAIGWAVLAIAFAPLRQTRSRVDAVTGSMEWQTTWPFGITRGPRVDVSPLELKLIQMGVPWTRDWRTLHVTDRTLFGGAIKFECGSAPPIYSLRSALEEYVAAANDEQICRFVEVMANGTEEQQKSAVDEASEVALGDRTGQTFNAAASSVPAAGN